ERNMKVRSERHELPMKKTRTLLKKVWTAAERNMKARSEKHGKGRKKHARPLKKSPRALKKRRRALKSNTAGFF
ncbi:hypothetical protein, partial [Bacteroides pyogenes]